MARPSATQIVELVADPGTVTPLPSRRTTTDDADYAAALQQARQATGLDEAVFTATARLDGREVVLVAGEFGFLGGSVGVGTSSQILDAVDHATRHGLPLLALPSSGGTRMQEGTLAFVQMVKIGQAVLAHRAAGLPYLVHLRHPTTGGVMASWASLGQVTTAQPGAMVGFLGPRVQEALVGQRIRDGVQRAEHLAEVGVVDAVVPDEKLREAWSRVLRTLCDEPTAAPKNPVQADISRPDPWEAVVASRRDDRPGIVELLAASATDVAHLSGTGNGQTDPAVTMGLMRIGGQPCVVVGTCREKQRAQQLGPAALRMAQRAIALAGELGLPVVTVVDTPGASLTEQAESDALSGEIARTLAALVAVRTPVLSVLMGQGSGGAALALMPSDASIVAQNGWLAPLPPEGSSAILHRTAERADEMARAQGIAATHLVAHGLCDQVVPEPDVWTPESSRAFCQALGAAVAAHLAALREVDDEERMARRRERFRSLGA